MSRRYAGPLLLAAVAGVFIVNWLGWRRDQRALMALRSRQSASPAPLHGPLVSFLVPAWNEADQVEACTHSILSLRYPNKELILCAGGSDATFEICRRYAGDGVIVLEQQPGEGKQGALRRSFERSSGEIIYLTDADCLVDDGCVEATLAPLLLEGESAVTGCWQPFEFLRDQPFVAWQWANHLRFQAYMPEWSETLDGRNSAVCRAALVGAGAFQNEAATGTDYVLSQELKAAHFRIRSVLASRVQTEYPAAIPAYLQQGSRWYRNRLVQGLKYGQWRDVALSLWAAAASMFILAGGAGALLLRKRAAASIWLIGILHLGLSMVRLAGFFRLSGFGRNRYIAYVLKFFVYALISNLAMVMGLLDSLHPQARKKW